MGELGDFPTANESKTSSMTSESEALASSKACLGMRSGGSGKRCYFKRSGFINTLGKNSLGSMCSHTAD